MKAFITFHEIPKVILLTAGFQRRFVVKYKARGHLVAMKTLFHYGQTAGNINHLPNV
jgi:hypothetical protein